MKLFEAELRKLRPRTKAAAESDPFGSDRRSPTGLVPSARKVLGGGGLEQTK